MPLEKENKYEVGVGATSGATENPLKSRDIRLIQSWSEWKQYWEKSDMFYYEVSGMLAFAFNIPIKLCDLTIHSKSLDECIDRLAFFFTIADGWEDVMNFKSPGEPVKEYLDWPDGSEEGVKFTVPELRQNIATMAFASLSDHLFLKMLGNGSDKLRDEWEFIITSERLFPVIQRFFQLEKCIVGMKLRNLTIVRGQYSHGHVPAAAFLMNLAKYVFGWKPSSRNTSKLDANTVNVRNEQTYLRLEASKPWLIEVLNYLGQIDLLRPWRLELSQACLAKLEEIAMRAELKNDEHPVLRRRKVESIEEAVFEGSPAALFLEECRSAQAEQLRLTTILNAERVRNGSDNKSSGKM